MMLFMTEHVEMILTGHKTETRRLWKKPRAKIGSIHKAKTKMLSKNFFAYLEILDVYLERLGDISDESIKAEGYDSLEAYKAVIQKANKRKKFVWNPDQLVYVVKFKVVNEVVINDIRLPAKDVTFE